MTEDTRSVVVTGAASGMGAAVATRFSTEGWRVLAVDVDTGGLDRLRAELGDRVRPLTVEIGRAHV